jgi:hypothetical protein
MMATPAHNVRVFLSMVSLLNLLSMKTVADSGNPTNAALFINLLNKDILDWHSLGLELAVKLKVASQSG